MMEQINERIDRYMMEQIDRRVDSWKDRYNRWIDDKIQLDDI